MCTLSGDVQTRQLICRLIKSFDLMRSINRQWYYFVVKFDAFSHVLRTFKVGWFVCFGKAGVDRAAVERLGGGGGYVTRDYFCTRLITHKFLFKLVR